MKVTKFCFNLLILLLIIRNLSYSGTVTAKKVTALPAIDGMLEESFWDISNQNTVNPGSSDNTASFGVLWNDEYLYVGVNVTDTTLCTNGRQGFYDDGIEICIDGNNSLGTTFDQYDRIFVKPVKSYWIQEMEKRYDGVIHKWIKTAGGYSMEFAIPWSNFSTTPSAGLNVGFNVVVNDDDNCSNHYNDPAQLLWTGNSSYYNNPSTWGTLVLGAETVSYSGKYIALVNPNGGDFLINNLTTTVNWISSGITNINIDYSTDNGGSWNSVATNLSTASNSYNWTVSATPSEQCLLRISETGNSGTNDISESLFTISAPLTAVEPLIPNTWKNYQWPYNAYFPEDPNGINGHVGNACGHASLARILHYWEFPIVGNDALTFTDNTGHTWSANFGATTYNYDNMPAYLSENSTEPEYTDVATLTYHAATSMHDIYGSGGDLDNMSYAMSHYFRFKVSTPADKNDYTRAEWIKILLNELDNGRVLLVGGMTTDFMGEWHESNWIAGHWYHIDGYNENGLFHVVRGYGYEDGYFDAEDLLDYPINIGILVGLEPNLNGKELTLQNLNDGERVLTGQATPINWNSTGVSNIRIEYTLDNGKTWQEIVSSTSASAGSYAWTAPNTISDACKIKLTDTDDINVYDKSNKCFSILSYDLVLTSPNGGAYFVRGSNVSILWKTTPVSNIKIEYSIDNGSSWNEITASTSAVSGSFDWIIPNVSSTQCEVRISDVTDAAVFDKSDDLFEIGPANNAGGPYIADENTIVLLHFDGNLKEEASDYSVISQGSEKSYIKNPVSRLNEAIYFDNSASANKSFLTIPYSSELSLSNNWTIDFWLYISGWDQDYNKWPVPILLPTTGWDSNYFLEIPGAEGRLKYGFKSNDGGATLYSSQNSLTTATWYHVALINDYDNHTIKLILRDSDFQTIEEQSASYTEGTIISTGTQDLRIGAGTAGDNYLYGYMDELRISDVVREFTQVHEALEFSPLADMPTPKYGLGYTSSTGYIYAASGCSDNGKTIIMERFSITDGIWSEFATGLVQREYCSAEYIPSQNKIYVLNGRTENTSWPDTVDIIDAATGARTFNTSNPFPVYYGGSAVWDNKIYTFGGKNGDGNSNRLYEYDPSLNVWKRLADMPEAKQTNGIIVDGVLYVFGGYSGTTSARIDAYNIEQDSWTYLGEMPVGISTHAVTASGDYIWLVGSYSNLSFLAVYNTKTNEFTELTSNMSPRRHAAAQALGSKLYVFGGHSGSAIMNSLEAADISIYVTALENDNPVTVADDFMLYQNYPNPFNPNTSIKYQVVKAGDVELTVYNMLGKKIAVLVSGRQSAGEYRVSWNAAGFPSGVYFYSIKAGTYKKTKKMILIR